MTQKNEDQPDVTRSPDSSRATRTRERIFAAVIRCLDESGYSETSINRVQQTAGVSRGALTHHFPTKEQMMVRTLEHLLDPVRGPSSPMADAGLLQKRGAATSLSDDLSNLWRRIINTREGRALIEILVASRTDAPLRAQIAPTLQTYNDEANRNILHLYSAPSGHDVALLWSICRSFMRGLHTHSPFERDPENIEKMVDLFGQIMAPHLAIQPTEEEK